MFVQYLSSFKVVSVAGLTRSLLRQKMLCSGTRTLLGGLHQGLVFVTGLHQLSYQHTQSQSSGSAYTVSLQSSGSAYTVSQALRKAANMLVCVTVLFNDERLQFTQTG